MIQYRSTRQRNTLDRHTRQARLASGRSTTDPRSCRPGGKHSTQPVAEATGLLAMQREHVCGEQRCWVRITCNTLPVMTVEEDDDTGLFEGIPYADLRIDSIDWLHRAEYIRTRSQRKGSREFDVEPEWATEAALDPRRLVGRGSSETSVQVVGWSSSAPGRPPGTTGRVLKVWLVPKDHPPSSGDWWGSNACDGNGANRRAYEGEAEDD